MGKGNTSAKHHDGAEHGLEAPFYVENEKDAKGRCRRTGFQRLKVPFRMEPRGRGPLWTKRGSGKISMTRERRKAYENKVGARSRANIAGKEHAKSIRHVTVDPSCRREGRILGVAGIEK